MKKEDKLLLYHSLAWKILLVFLVIALFGPRGLLREEPGMAGEHEVRKSDEGEVQVGQSGAGEYRDIELLRPRI